MSEPSIQKTGETTVIAANVVGIPLAAFDLLNPMLAGAAMAFQQRQRGEQRAAAAPLALASAMTVSTPSSTCQRPVYGRTIGQSTD
jgi:hypothetical protein